MAEENQTADDISQQYQQILNQYANEITPPPTPTPTSPGWSAAPADNTPALPVSPPEIALSSPPKPAGNFFKYFFFFSVFIFLTVVAALVYSILSSQQIINNKISPAAIPAAPTSAVSNQTNTPAEGVCQLNDKTYGIGNSFAAADGCNTCSCQSDLTIKCSENECPSQP